MDSIHKEVLLQQIRRRIHALIDGCTSLEDLDLIYKILIAIDEEK